MLVLSRKSGERIQIGEYITVTIVRIGACQVQIGIDAPDEVNIVREELLENFERSKLDVQRSTFEGVTGGDQG